MSSKRNLAILAVTLFLLGLIASALYYKRPGSEMIEVRKGDITEAVYGLGKVKSNKIYELKIGVTSGLSALFAQEGDRVQKGQRLLRLDEGSVVSAPFAGTITVLPFHEGENIFPQAVIVRVEDLDDLYVEVSLEQLGALRVRPAQDARLTLESLRGVVVSGKVESIFPKDDQFVVRINTEKLPKEVLPGMTADVAIEVGRRTGVLLLPLGGLTNGRVTVIRDGRRRKVPVKIGIVDGNWAEVIEGDVKPGDQVLIPARSS
ncbi:MAG TPA: efflux RND transporter periplasmic adaptor subunit [Bdellovibrionales bacterium]|nr:efflux RND transporter periplasmic adaptor subunit [Bdellovibrionales bacterium]